MPELPEVETVARDLRRLLFPDRATDALAAGGRAAGPTITGARVSWARTLRSGDEDSFWEGVAGRRIEGIGRRGKQLVVDLSGGAFLTIHLKMTGQLFVVPASTPEDPYLRLVLTLDDGRELRFRDIRKFGRIGFYVADDDPFDDVGPEPLDPGFTVREFRKRIRARRGRLKPLLVDQSFLAGVGNIYADEGLWRARLHPLRSARTLRPADEGRLYRHIRDVLAEAIVRRGSSIDDYTAPDGDGSMQDRLDVYQRTGEPCRRCGRPIRRIVIGIRSTHFCSFCQRLPAGERARATAILRTMTPRPGRAGAGRDGTARRGRRWTELAGAGSLGRTAGEERAARERTERTRKAAAARRAAARVSAAGGGTRVSLVRLEGVGREVGTFVILERIDAAIAAGERIGLVGPNGAGKTTLLRIAAGADEPDRGSVTRRRGLTLGLLAQEAHFDAAFMAAPDLRTAVRHGAAHLETMADQLAELEHGGHAGEQRYAELQHRFDVLGGYTLDQRVDEALSGLGFARDEWGRPPTAMSGGQQTRAALARLVIADPDLLLLDEPTNHLDLGALEWLEEHLRRRSSALLVASHDRAFLDATVTRVWELRDRRLTVFRGDYSAYHRQRVERDARSQKDAETQAQAIEREKELVQRYRSHRKFAKMHEHEARLERLQADRTEAPRKSRSLALPGRPLAGGPVRSGELVLRLEDLVVGYLPGRGAVAADGTPASEPARVATTSFLGAQRGERIGIVGPNGAGKTTLLRTIAGDLPPLDGSLAFGHNVAPSYLAQLRDAAIPGATVLDALLEAIPVTPGEARGYLARFLFRGDDAFKEVRSLSGGERSRLELALLGVLPSNLLLLDEPTNHLDIPAREAIEAFLAESPATLLVVSHDRRLLETICERLWVVDDGLAVPFEGGYRAWRAAVADGWTVRTAAEREAARLRPGAGRAAPAAVRDAATTPEHAPAAGGRGPGVAVAPAPTVPVAAPRSRPAKLSKDAYRRRRETLDADLGRLGLRKTQLELAMGNPSIAANFVELRRITSELADVDAALAAAEDAWLELEELAP